MNSDVEEHVRRSLAAEVDDVEPDPATWAAVQARIRRRAVVRWSATGLATAAALLTAALVLPGLVTETRIDLSPADPGALSDGAPGLVHTDGRRIVITDASGEPVTLEVAAPDQGQSIRRLAVRPGSTADDLTVAYLVAGEACDRAQMRWVTVDRAGTRGGFLDEGGGYCLTDPVWSPDGSVAAWVRRQPPGADSFEPAPAAGGDVHLLIFRGWFDGGPAIDEPHASNQFTYLDLSPLEDGRSPVRALRATAWDWTDGVGALHLSATFTEGPMQAARVGPISPPANPGDSIDVPVQPQDSQDPNGPGEYPSALVEPRPLRGDAPVLVTAERHQGAGTEEDPRYALVLQDRTPQIWLQRTVGNTGHGIGLPADVLDAEQVEGGDVWLSAWGDTAVLGVGGNAWAWFWREGDHDRELEALPGVVHADVLGWPGVREPPLVP